MPPIIPFTPPPAQKCFVPLRFFPQTNITQPGSLFMLFRHLIVDGFPLLQAHVTGRSRSGRCSPAQKPDKTCYNYRKLDSNTCPGSGLEKDRHEDITSLP